MKIGIDLTPLPSNPVGAGTYMIQLVRALVALPTEHQFVLFSQQRGKKAVGDLPSDRAAWVITPDRDPAARLIWEQLRLPNLVRSSGIQLLHSLHYTRPFLLPCHSIVTFHDMTFFLFPEMHTRSKRLFFPRAIRFSAKHSDSIIAVSDSTRRDAIRILNLPPERIVAVPNGIDQVFRPVADRQSLQECKRKYGLPDEFILYLGLIEPRKNVPLLLDAYAHLSRQKSIPPLVLAGRRGWMVDEVFRLIDELQLKDKILLPGYIDSDDLPLIYNLASIFVYPSTYEGFGFPPLEAMACGTPVITTAVSAMLDYVGEAGLLVPPQDEQALTSALDRLLSDPVLRERLTKEGPAHAAPFTWERTARETMNIYEKFA